MRAILESGWAWISAHVFTPQSLIIATSVSLLLLAASLILVPWLLLQMPADYFMRRRLRLRDEIRQGHTPRAALRIGKNLLGALLLVAGVLMLALPGQGLLTLLVAFILMDYPGKHRLERRIIRIRGVKSTADWLRRRYGRKPFDAPLERRREKPP